LWSDRPVNGCRLAAALAVLGCLLAATPASAETYRVTRFDDADVCDPLSGCTLRGAITLANRNEPFPDTVLIPAGTYALTGPTLSLTDTVAIVGEGARRTIVDGNGVVRGLHTFLVGFGTTAGLSHLTLRDGGADGLLFGGNLLNAGGVATLDHVRITGGRASSGGGVANQAGTMLISHSLIDENRAVTGGGDGGGVANIGVEGIPGVLTLRNTTLTGNEARLGGAVSQWNGPENRMTLENVTAAGNRATDRGGGFIGDDPGEADGTLTIRGSLIAGNRESLEAGTTPSNCDVIPTDAGGNLEDGQDCRFGRQGVDPRLVGLRDEGGETDVLPIDAGSPARDISTAACATSTDQRDVARPQGATCDAGAHELTVTYSIALVPGDGTARVGTTQDITVRVLELGRPLPGAAVQFSVDDGPNSGLRQAATTNSGGEATLPLASPVAGTDTVRATFTDPQGRRHTASASRTWTVPDARVALAPAAATGAAGTMQSVTATVTEDGEPQSLRPVTFTILSGPHAGGSGTAATGPDGTASFAYRGTAAGTDTIAGTFQDSVGRTQTSNAVQRIWTASPGGGTSRSDGDGDGVVTATDNCPGVANADQADRDGDDIGNRCDRALPPGDLPVVVGQVARVAELSGTVLVRLPASGRRGFVRLRGIATVPVGSVIDARKGRLALTTAATFGSGRRARRRVQRGRFAAAMFAIRQARRARRDLRRRRARLVRPSTDLVLRTPRGLTRACLRTNSPTVGSRKGVVRTLRGSGKGLYRTVAGASVTTTTNAAWTIEDRCGGTVTRVTQGTARVLDLSRRRTVVVRAGRTYLAQARLFGARARRARRPPT
jgi:hypothetical protein